MSLKEKSYYEQHKLFSDYPMSENEFRDIDNYKDAIENFVKAGYLVLRMGDSNVKRLNFENKLFLITRQVV